MEEQQPPPRQRITSSMITALAAGVVSLSALTVSIYEAYLMREQQAASVLPIIDFWAAFVPDDSYSLNLANKGLGPAFIKHINVLVDEKPLGNWHEVTQALTTRSIPHNESALIGSVLAPGETGTMLGITDDGDSTEIWENAHRIDLVICYCSVFGNCWTTTISQLNTGTPSTIETSVCPAGDDVIF